MQVPQQVKINGSFLYHAFLAGGNNIINNQVELNRINLFPVPDKDTGSNLASTVRSIIDNTLPHRSYKITLQRIAQAALVGARGNSGIIFAQFLYGLSHQTPNSALISLNEFAHSLKQSIPFVYQSMSNPVEGTMLTVIKDWANYIFENRNNPTGFQKIISDSLTILEQSLKETNQKLKSLRTTNLVDAGAKGFVVFIQGVLQFIQSGKKEAIRPTFISTADIDIHDHYTSQYRYCTEAILKDVDIELSILKEQIASMGDSLVIAGDKALCRIHIHTNQPADFFQELQQHGQLTSTKADDMIRQQAISVDRKWDIALVTDSTCDLPKEFIEKYQIHVIPLHLSIGDNQHLDGVTITPQQFYQQIERTNQVAQTSQINEQTFTNLYSYLTQHYKAIVAIHLTSHFSGTGNNSLKAAQKVEKESGIPIRVIDSKTLSGALGLLVAKAAWAIEAQTPLDELIKEIEECKTNAQIFVSVKSLKYMIRSGRLSKTTGWIVNKLGILPIVSMQPNGESRLLAKTFGQKRNIQKVFSHVESITKKEKVWNYIVLHADNEALATTCKLKMVELTGLQPLGVVNISPVIGNHAGKDCVAISLLTH
ncbi:DegV family EDD domain-containing protein [Prolixibacteraceae bacterium JC049]|nr:DegV family EDD domain-containing protein [Prolixibacteraceae bacterium JC049]